MASKKRRRRRKSQLRRIFPVLAAFFLIFVVAAVMGISFFVKKYTPSDERMDLKEYFSLEADNEVAILLEDELTDLKGILIDGEAYVDTDTLYNHLNSRFYWDAQENLLLYTTPTEVITAEVGSRDYTVAKEKHTESYAPVKVDGDTAYVALKYIQKFTALEFEVMTDEVNRVHIAKEFGTAETVTAKKNASVRYRAGIKSPILTEVGKGDVLYVLPEDEDIGKWLKVRTVNGYIGYIQERYLGEYGEVTTQANYEEPEYSHMTKDYTINMAWHQVTNTEANSKVLETIAKTKGLTTICPTWFSLKDNDGNIESRASHDYVNYCHQNGIEVWALLEDITYKDTIINYEIFSRTSSRQKLVNNLIAKAIEYDLDGLNLDCEYINEQTGKAYVQFIRELSIMCRLNGIILSVDNYVPIGGSSHYNRREQGIVADYVVIMGYDEHYAGSEEAGSVASIGYVRNGIEQTIKEVPAERIINGVPFYTRLWEERPKTEAELASESDDGKAYVLSSKAYGMTAAKNLLEGNGAEIVWDEECGQYYAEYTEGETVYRMWLEEEESIALKAALIKEYQLAGISAWKLGFERQEIWDVILRYVN